MGVIEFQAVVLAGGRGTRLPELTGDRPKCLLPIGPFPLIWYPLQMLQKHGFQGNATFKPLTTNVNVLKTQTIVHAWHSSPCAIS